MKIKLTNDLSEFSDIGTIVYYQERPFYPETDEVYYPEDLLKKSVASGYFYSTSLPTEYVDFAKSGFTLYPEVTEDLLPNLFSLSDVSEILGGIDGVDDLVSSSLPTFTETSGPHDKHFFGKLTTPTETSYLVHLPKGTWKVEIYNSKIAENYGGSFIDHDVLSRLGLTSSVSPSLTIYFGPGYSVRIQDNTYQELQGGSFPTYWKRYTLEDEVVLLPSEYEEFQEVMTKGGYLESYREEVQSEKLLYILNTPNGEIGSINFFPIAYPESKNPHPHMSEEVLRNDTLWKTMSFLKSPRSGLIFDSRSGVLLGTKELGESESSWIRGALERGGYSRSGCNREAIVNGRTWRRAIREEVFGEDPEISPFWYSPDSLPESVFKYFYISTKGKGSTKPSGLIYLGPGHPLSLTINPGRGYVFSGFSNVWDSEITTSGSGKVQINTSRFPQGYKFEAIFSEILYSLNLQLTCSKDYRGNNGLPMTYNLSEIGSPSGNAYTPLSRTDIKLIYLSEDGKEIIYGSPEDNHNKLNPLHVSDSQDLYIKLDTSGSPYELSGDLYYGDGSNIQRSGDWYVLKVSEFPGSTSDYIIPVGELVSKKYTVDIKSTSGIQISTPKKVTLEYHNMDPESKNPVTRPYTFKMVLGSQNTVVVKRDGVETTNGSSWSMTEEGEGVWTFTIPAIQNNYEIIIR